MTDERYKDLVGRVVWTKAAEHRHKHKRNRLPFWSVLGNLFSLGSTSSCELAKEFGYDPETGEAMKGGGE